MNKPLLFAVALTISVTVVGTANAIDFRGRIEKVDVENNIIELTNGITMHYGDSVDESTLTPGASVRADCKNIKGRYEVRKLRIIPKDK
jgi:hypothetical protein